jgi:hypothetical protein
MSRLIPAIWYLLAFPALSQPAPTAYDGLPVSGPISAHSGQVIEGLHVISQKGPCIIVGPDTRDVTIRNSEIGPCGTNAVNDYGVWILPGSSEIRVIGNVIHDVATGVKAAKAKHPIMIEKNFFYHVRGPFWSGQAIQFNGVAGGDRTSRITCNVSDANYGSGPKAYEDHISVFQSHGTERHPIEITANRIRGGTSQTGGGITVGDKGGSWIAVKRNAVVKVSNSGIGVAGGSHILVEENTVDNRGANRQSQTHMAYFVRALSPCMDIVVRGNKGVARLWIWGETDGRLVQGYRHGPEYCRQVVESDNIFGDQTIPDDLFDITPADCR